MMSRTITMYRNKFLDDYFRTLIIKSTEGTFLNMGNKPNPDIFIKIFFFVFYKTIPWDEQPYSHWSIYISAKYSTNESTVGLIKESFIPESVIYRI